MVCARVTLREHVPLAPYTTLGVGGPARWFVEAADEAAVREALGWARARGLPLRVPGGGPDAGGAGAGGGRERGRRRGGGGGARRAARHARRGGARGGRRGGADGGGGRAVGRAG